ncbi:hypothetical protein [Alkalicoccus halolimnae]|uniref:Outer membrane lipoprotein carrier protein LolA n=1 Tax=Alkalicoccus halolimnae TaxID=1667239 RepID=A0A5C7F8H1_9BACI|nr:hypothetical protein [Alkalicoccus halolimnae]TXF86952.1 hypothetical protein FTX54_03235 [Alkalicoccus halolimnae]
MILTAIFRGWRPAKRWIIPVIAAVVGLAAGWLLFPTQQDYHYQELRSLIDEMEQTKFDVEATYEMDGETALQAAGSYSPGRSIYDISTPVSDDTTFDFTIYLEEETFYAESGGSWSRGERPHPITAEMSPLDDPFSWMKTILPEADELSKQGSTITLFYNDLDDVDFQGYTLQEQEETTLVVDTSGEEMTVTFTVNPVRPEDVPILNRYPENMIYSIRFTPRERELEKIPEEAEDGEVL